MARKQRATFKPGDIVALKSGSPRMSVVESDADYTKCIWCDYDTKTLHSEDIPTAVLNSVVYRGANQ